MVNGWGFWPCLANAGDEKTARSLDPLLRAKLLMALLGLVVLGIGLMALVVLAGWFARRKARLPSPQGRMSDDRWYAKPLVPREAAETAEPDGESSADESEGATD